jgi:hypothetical protein
VDDVAGTFTNAKNTFTADALNAALTFEWWRVSLFYVFVSMTTILFGIGIWGYFRDKSDALLFIDILPKGA